VTAPSITIFLSAPERDVILKYVKLPTNIVARLRFAVYTTKGLELTLAGDDLLEFGEAMDEALPRIKKRADALLVESVFRNFLMSIDALIDDDHVPDLQFPPDLPPAIREAVQHVLETQEFSSREAMMRAVQEAIIRADDSPHEELFGHTTGEVIALLGDDWTQIGGAFTLDENLSAEQLADSSLCMDAIRFLSVTERTGGLKLTARKNLNRESVRLLLDSDCFPGVRNAQWLQYLKVINETDVYPLNLVHILLLEMGLVRHFKGKMVITKSGKRALEPGLAGSLQCAMFHALFKEIDLAFLDELPEYRGVQTTVPFILYAIQQMAREPIAADDLMAKAYMPAVAAEFYEYPRHASLAFYTRILQPLTAFGLIQFVPAADESGHEKAHDQVQITPLFNAMLHFDLKAG
jgi:hypothetical protein